MSIKQELRPIFEPTSIAFVGASNVFGKWGNRMIANAYRSGFPGPIYPVNPKEEEVIGLKAYPSVLEIPGDVDLAVFTMTADQVPRGLRECAQKGVRGAVIISAGFAEAGSRGQALQEECNQVAKAAGIRFVGPNCMGVYSSSGRLNLAFDAGRASVNPGSVAFISQSGTLGTYLAINASMKGYGLCKFVSAGNQANISFADYLEYLRDDPHTRTIILYIEGLSDGRRFFEAAKDVVRYKPILAYKAGRTKVGARASLSHTASLTGADEVFDAMCRQVGIIRGNEVMHPFEMAEALTRQPLPKGNRVAVISGGGGQCVTIADACAGIGLELPEFDEEVQARIRKFLAPHAPDPRNPVDLAAAGGPQTVAAITDLVAQVDYIDGIITTQPFGAMGRRTTPEAARAMIAAAEMIAVIPRKYGKPVITIGMRFGGSVASDILANADIPAYEEPEETAIAMAALAKYSEVRRFATEDGSAQSG